MRMGASVPKQFLPLLGMPVMCYAIQAFARAIRNIRIILVVPAEQINSAQTVIRSYLSGLEVTTVTGGETRFHSVQNGLKHVQNDGVVFVHDGVRPLVTLDLIQRCYEQAMEKGSAIPAVPVNDSMRLIDGQLSTPVNREYLRIVQTPQTFLTEVLLPAFAQEYSPAFTDEATVVEANGGTVSLIDGSRDNIKVTTREDMAIAETLLRASD